jgi:hypothetical protein
MHEYVLRRRLSSPRAPYVAQGSDESFTNQIMEFVFEFEDSMTINDRLKSIYGQLPVRMSKIKLHEWIEKALIGMNGIQVKDFENYLIYLTETYHPEGVKNYGVVMKPIFEELKSFNVLYNDIVSEEILEPLEDRLYDIKEMLERCVSLYTYSAVVINNMLGLMSVFNEVSANLEIESIERCVKVLELITEKANEDVVIDASIVEVLDEISQSFESVRMENGKWDGLFEEVKKTYVDQILNQKLGKSYDQLSSLYILQSASYFAPLELAQDDLLVMDERILIDRKTKFIEAIDLISKDESRWVKRARISNLLSVINVVHKNQLEIRQHITDALLSCKDATEKANTKVVLNDMMVE